MLGDQKGSSKMIVLLAIVTLLSFCSPASSFAFLPRVSRTDDAVIIDCIQNYFLFFKFEHWLNVIYYLNSVAGVGYAPSYQGKTLYGQIVDPRFVPLPSFNPYPMTYRHQEQTPNGWIYSYGYPTPLALEDVLPVRQSPATQCGIGPAMPATRALTSERIAGGTSAKKNAWPFMVS
jgi:hypothetical protein